MPRTPADRTPAGSPFLGLLAGAEPLDDAVESQARALGLDPAGSFCVVAIADAAADLSAVATPHVAATVDGATVAVVQAADVATVAAAVAETAPEAVAGVSALRPGLAGARLGLIDARQALALARARGTTVLWEDCWWLAVLTDHVDQLLGVVTPTWTFAAANTHLTDAVEAYADESFSSTRAARRLFVHPNTVLYRLRQWHRNTGLNPSGISGLAASVAAVQLGRLVDRDNEAAAAARKS